MTDPSILAIRRQLAFQRAAESLEVDATLPSTRAPSIYMETYLSEFLLAVTERLDILTKRIDDLEADVEEPVAAKGKR